MALFLPTSDRTIKIFKSMKKTVLLLMTAGTLSMSAQNSDNYKRKGHRNFKAQYTPEQRAELRASRMTLTLDLNDSQQADLSKMFMQLEKDKPTVDKKRSEMTSEDRYALRKARLDHQIATKRGLKNILNAEQMAKWEKQQKQMHSPYKRKSAHKRWSRK